MGSKIESLAVEFILAHVERLDARSARNHALGENRCSGLHQEALRSESGQHWSEGNEEREGCYYPPCCVAAPKFKGMWCDECKSMQPFQNRFINASKWRSSTLRKLRRAVEKTSDPSAAAQKEGA